MAPILRHRCLLLIALTFALSPCLRGADPAKPATEYFTGKVVPLADVLAKSGLTLDKAEAAKLLALLVDDGKVYPLRNEENGRMFYSDKTLLNRPMRLTAREVGAGHFLQVFQVHSIIKGELHEVYYWCDICTIKRHEKKDCECCGAPMELREEKVKK